MTKFCIALSFVVMYLPFLVAGQDIDVDLLLRTESGTSFHITPLLNEPSEHLVTPDFDGAGALFGSVFYSSETNGNSTVSIAVVPTDEGERIYVDLNNNEDLTDDGEPRLFRSAHNEFHFYIQAESDTNRRVGRVLYRLPPSVHREMKSGVSPDSNIVDSQGNLSSFLLQRTPYFPVDFEGRQGTFYFDGRHSLSRGVVSVDGDRISTGIYDYNENGLFNDEEDLLFIDINRDGKLNHRQTDEIFRLDDVVTIADRRFKVKNVEPYGTGFSLSPTTDEPTHYYLRERIDEKANVAFAEQRARLDESFWELELTSLEGESISLSQWKGRYILLNFWGEWCAPCMEEIPELVAARSQIPSDKLIIIGMLLSYDLEAARDVMSDFGMDWPQVRVDDDLQTRFRVRGYPTNILILPDGKSYLSAGQIGRQFLLQRVH